MALFLVFSFDLDRKFALVVDLSVTPLVEGRSDLVPVSGTRLLRVLDIHLLSVRVRQMFREFLFVNFLLGLG